MLIVGVAIGLAWGYLLSPVVWTDAGAAHLEESRKIEWIKLVADQLKAHGQPEHAAQLLADVGADAGPLLDRLIAENPGDDALVRLKDIYTEDVQAQAQAVQSRADSRQGPSIAVLIIVVAVIILLWGIWAAFGQMLVMILRNSVPLLLSRRKFTGEHKGPTAAQRTAGLKVAQEAAATQSTDYSASDEGPPLVQYMSTYLMGDDLYDDSFSIERGTEFLGETGAGISEVVGVGDPKKVTAIEAWLFDKNDIRTVTKVLMSEHAFYDEALRAKLAPKGEAVLAEPNAIIELDTNTLRVRVRVVDLAYGADEPMPPNSYFERLTIELAAWATAEAEGPPPIPPHEAFGDTIAFQ
ncbi:MAG: hypothetical protein JXB47_09780 [Anaerolineae bacterium]|nr:hypothetical protein [Anaerolineae bacterium]